MAWPSESEPLRHLPERNGRPAPAPARHPRTPDPQHERFTSAQRRDPNLFVLWQLGVRPEAGV